VAEERPPAVYLITGLRAAGTSAVAGLLASRFERGMHLEGEAARSDPTQDAPDVLPARCRLAAAGADAAVDDGFTVALEDVVAPALLGDYRTVIRSRPCHVIVLTPSLEAAAPTPRVGIWLETTHLTAEETVDEILAQTSSPASPVVVVPYDDEWRRIFDRIAGPVRDAVAGLGAHVEHVGSTSVPGLAAKPIIDIDVVVRSPDDVPTAIERLRALGYVYQGDKGIPGREAFMWPSGARAHHLYVVVDGSPPHADHVRFRDHLREHPDVAQRYAALKTSLADRFRDDRLGYTNAKTEFITGVLSGPQDH
jgi:GrpB-like predicted nucleotidyltransferase (UPF0157 family)